MFKSISRIRSMRNGQRTRLASLAMAAAMAGWCGAAQTGDELPEAQTPAIFALEPLMLAERPATAPKAEDWHAILRLGLWAMNVDGDASARDYDVDFSMDFGDLLDNTNFAFMGGLEIGKGKWAVVFEGMIAQLENDQHFNHTLPRGRTIEGGADISLDMYIADLALGYRLWDIPLGDGKSEMMLSITPAVGLRYTHMSVEVNPDRFESRDSSQDLWDPYVGGRVNLQISREVAWRTDASVGGFGVGSDLTWSAQSFIDWRFHRSMELNVGYRAMYWDYKDGDFELDLTMHGPWIGISFHWN